jgi:hypothetical protein
MVNVQLFQDEVEYQVPRLICAHLAEALLLAADQLDHMRYISTVLTLFESVVDDQGNLKELVLQDVDSVRRLQAVEVNHPLFVVELVHLVEGVPRNIEVYLLFDVLQLLVRQGHSVVLLRLQIGVVRLLIQRFAHCRHLPADLTVPVLGLLLTRFHRLEGAIGVALHRRMLGVHGHILCYILGAPEISGVGLILLHLDGIELVGGC